MRTTKKQMYTIAILTLSIIVVVALLSSMASASLNIYKTPLGAGTPPATQLLTAGGNSIDYTAVPASSTDPRIVQFKDLSKGTETYISWEFGDGTYLSGTKITPQLKNPVHKFPKTGYYIGGLTIRCTGYNGLLWVHKTIIIKAGGTTPVISPVKTPIPEVPQKPCVIPPPTKKPCYSCTKHR